MAMNPWLIILLIVIVGSWFLELVTELLNLRSAEAAVPAEFADVFDPGKYQESQRYLRENTRFGLLHSTIAMALLLAAIFAGGFNWLDRLAREVGHGEITSGLVFGAGFALAVGLLNLPFSCYSTFVIEARYGFNRTSLRTFILDRIKVLILGALLGAPLFAGVIWFFEQAELAWLWAWLTITVFQLLVMFLAPIVILPLFNKFIPLEDGELKTRITEYAASQDFALKGVFTTDGSKRSTKANAYFVGFGRFRRIVLFDTLIDNHSIPELVAILAHEMGHFKRRHIHKLMLIGIGVLGLMLYLFSFFIGNDGLFAAFHVEQTSVYASLIFIAILFGPINTVFSVVVNRLACRFEYQADRYAADTCENGAEHLISALKTLTADNLGNLTPHPLKVLLEYDHPPVLERIRKLRE